VSGTFVCIATTSILVELDDDDCKKSFLSRFDPDEDADCSKKSFLSRFGPDDGRESSIWVFIAPTDELLTALLYGLKFWVDGGWTAGWRLFGAGSGCTVGSGQEGSGLAWSMFIIGKRVT